MRLEPHRTRGTERLDPAIPLINVVFLLLVFVMLTMAIEPLWPFDVRLPESAADTKPRPGPTNVRFGAGGELSLDTEPMSRDELMTAVGDQQAAMVVIAADRDAPASEALRLAQDLRNAGAIRVELAVAQP